MNKEITLQQDESVKIITNTGESIRVIVREDTIEIIGVDYSRFYVEPSRANSIIMKLK